MDTETENESLHHELYSSSGLLKEYTEKLKYFCDSKVKENNRKKFMYLNILLVFISAIFLFIIFKETSVPSKASFFSTINIVLYSVLLLITLFIVSFYFKNRFYSRDTEARRSAAILRRILSMQSQYLEHSKRKIKNPIEIEVRLAEADAILTLYESLFGDYGRRRRSSEDRYP